ncbi:hypothetical protein HYH02_009362 [Chlamydomonas schloesseri]|uniref:Fatty acid desaturase domain-containing protein n=1 Tax=Chlamydomonas schloesseri TaxID=2026947 RepID=A0A835W7D5_9CHLO|nr:hypothetical protein HYH02_009362 [Chlamydomonas schloesseri]|eukprot:KAG2443292.1 hypothetical protein HYH02_009362 [Chlamydomonas schloesseri]
MAFALRSPGAVRAPASAQRASGVRAAKPGLLRSAAVARPRVATNAAAISVPVNQLTDEERANLARELGYKSIGKELPDGVTLTDIIKSMPQEVFQKDHGKAWRACLTSIAACAACWYLISISPWYLLPAAWALAGTAFTGFFVIGHDCGHRSFHENNLVEDIVGHLFFAPLIYPFEPWRIKHNHHHAHTNKLVEDTAWHPVTEEDMKKWDPTSAMLYKIFLGTPLKLWASVGHWLVWHFDLKKYTPKQQTRVIISLAVVYGFMMTVFPALIYFGGPWAFVKYWLMPWLGYHFWMSTFTVVHHTAPHIPFKKAEEWNAAKAQLSGTVHCDFPGWVEFLTHDISWHVPHHVAPKIPWYNLRKATESLRQNWGEYMTECTFNWRVVKNICTECHVYDEKVNYKPFDYQKEETLFAVQRRVLPDTAAY